MLKRLVWLTTTLVLFVVFIVPAILALTLKMIPASDQPGYNYDRRLSIYGKRGIPQEFVGKENNLTAVATSIRNPNLKNQKEVVFNLYDENFNLLRIAVLNGFNIEDGDFVKFIFAPIADSSGKKYKFILASPEAGPGETLEVFILNEPTPEILEYSYEDKTYPGGVPLVSFYKPASRWQTVRLVYANLLARLLHPDSQKAN